VNVTVLFSLSNRRLLKICLAHHSPRYVSTVVSGNGNLILISSCTCSQDPSTCRSPSSRVIFCQPPGPQNLNSYGRFPSIVLRFLQVNSISSPAAVRDRMKTSLSRPVAFVQLSTSLSNAVSANLTSLVLEAACATACYALPRVHNTA
jgi:hypothetical protein